MPRGGVRPGAGRPTGSKGRNRKPSGQLNMRWPPDVLAEVERLAERQGITRSEWVLRTVMRELQVFRPR